MSVFYILIGTILFSLFLYFGYKDDYKQDRIGFKITLTTIIGFFIISLGLYGLKTKTEDLIRPYLEEYYTKQLGWEKETGKIDLTTLKSEKDYEALMAKNHILTHKIDKVLTFFELLFYLFLFWVLKQFNKMVKRYFLKESALN